MGIPIIDEIIAILVGLWNNLPSSSGLKLIIFLILISTSLSIVRSIFEYKGTVLYVYNKPAWSHRLFTNPQCISAYNIINTGTNLLDINSQPIVQPECNYEEQNFVQECVQALSNNTCGEFCYNKINPCYADLNPNCICISGTPVTNCLGIDPNYTMTCRLACTNGQLFAIQGCENDVYNFEGVNTTYIDYCMHLIKDTPDFRDKIANATAYVNTYCQNSGIDFLDDKPMWALSIMVILIQFAWMYYTAMRVV